MKTICDDAPSWWISSAPLRISLAGGGTDLPSYADRHGGTVLGAAIDLRVHVEGRAGGSGSAASSRLTGSLPVQSDNPFAREVLRQHEPGIELVLTSRGDAPPGCGLGTSAAFCIAVLRGLRPSLHGAELAESACTVERVGLGRPVGSQDHYLSALAGFRLLRFLPGGTVEVEEVNASAEKMETLNKELLLFYTGVTRDAGHVLREQDGHVLSGNLATERRLHAIKELTADALDILEGRSTTALGEILGRHWELKKGLSSRVSLPIVEIAYRDALAAGSWGGKLLGAGGGGFLLLHAPRKAHPDVRLAMKQHGFLEKSFRFSSDGPRLTRMIASTPPSDLERDAIRNPEVRERVIPADLTPPDGTDQGR
ncbi:GHMP family kinase ATP-binding protein [Streptomyces sp. NPDC001073]